MRAEGGNLGGRQPTQTLVFWMVGAYAASELLARALGIPFAANTLGTLYQYLDPQILREDLLRGLYYLHAQPPLFNLYLGAVLKLFPGRAEAVFALSFAILGLATLVGVAWLMSRLAVPRFVVVPLCFLWALSPSFLAYTHWLFYTLPVAAILVGLAAALVHFLDRDARWSAHLFGWGAAVLMLTRALYHPLWLAVVVASLMGVVRQRHRRPLLAATIGPLALVLGLFLKNFLLVGTFAASSWVGMSLSKRWPLSQSEMSELRAEAKLPPEWHRRPFREPHELAPLGYFRGERETHPAIDAPYKSNGEPNFNHRDYARISRKLVPPNLYLIRRYPDRYVERTVTALLLFLQPGPNSVHFLVDYDFTPLHRMRDAITRYVFLGGSIERPIRMLDPPGNLWVAGFPLLLLFGAYRLGASRRQGDEGARALLAFFLVTLLWVTAAANLIEIGENDRMRWEVEPFLLVLLGSAIASVVKRFRRGSRSEVPLS